MLVGGGGGWICRDEADERVEGSNEVCIGTGTGVGMGMGMDMGMGKV